MKLMQDFSILYIQTLLLTYIHYYMGEQMFDMSFKQGQ